MAGKRVPELSNITPTTDDYIVLYDLSTDTTNRTALSSVQTLFVPSGISGLLFKALSANATGSDVATAQPWFPTAGAVSVEASKTYFFEGILRTSRAAGTTSHTTSLLFGGTATLTSILYRAYVNTTDVVTNAAVNQTASEVATAVVVKAASTSATEQIEIEVKGIIRTNAAGTLIPQFQYSAAPGGAPTVLANTYFRMYPIGSNVVTTSGTWA